MTEVGPIMIQAQPDVALSIDHMQMSDIDEVSRIERRSFTNPWPMSAYRRELRRPEHNSYYVLRAKPMQPADPHELRVPRGRFLETILPARRGDPQRDLPHLAGYVGMWQMYDETHITTIAVDPVYRGRGYGELLLVTAFADALARGSAWVSLEVRVSNDSAQALYRKYGMSVYGRRAAYYTDNHEDALVMWSRALKDADYMEQIGELRDRLVLRVPEVDVPDFLIPRNGEPFDTDREPPIL
jgi:[ribosomal protein S18]-alanine N-acetyltransferase